MGSSGNLMILFKRYIYAAAVFINVKDWPHSTAPLDWPKKTDVGYCISEWAGRHMRVQER